MTQDTPSGPPTAEASTQVNEHRAFQSVFWQVQRVAWVGLSGLLIMALLGLTGGSGWFSQGIVKDDHFLILYPAILRQQSEGLIVVTLLDPRRQTILHFDLGFQERFTVTGMTPPPVAAIATSTGVAYTFALSGTAPAKLRINITAPAFAHAEYSITSDGRMALLSTRILP